MDQSLNATQLADKIWQEINATALAAGLDASKFGDDHREIVRLIAEHLTDSAETTSAQSLTSWFKSRLRTDEQETASKGVRPIVICGVPGTGKTTFLYLVDAVLRNTLNIPDNITSTMNKRDGRSREVQKRTFNGLNTSLLSVSKWAQLLRFYAWDVDKHRLDSAEQTSFIQNTLQPMRVIFTDEVEIAGYSPAIPALAQENILVIGTSNQYEFRQLESAELPPHIFRFEGIDMRSGNPDDAVVTPEHVAWDYFDRASAESAHEYERLAYRLLKEDETLYVHVPFPDATRAALLDNEWIYFLQASWKKAGNIYTPLHTGAPYIFLFDNFSLKPLTRDFNEIIRAIALFDAIEQLEIGVLVRNSAETPDLTREAIEQMKQTVSQTPGITDEIKHKTLVGVDRFTSRIGQAGTRAQNLVQHLPSKE